jgi:hypothetical protein
MFEKQINNKIPELERVILETTLEHHDLNSKLNAATTCRSIAPTKNGELECSKPGSHSLFTGLGNLFLGSDAGSSLNFLMFSYVPIDAAFVGSILIAVVGAAYGAWVYMIVCNGKVKKE